MMISLLGPDLVLFVRVQVKFSVNGVLVLTFLWILKGLLEVNNSFICWAVWWPASYQLYASLYQCSPNAHESCHRWCVVFETWIAVWFVLLKGMSVQGSST
jgi:uncharacterized membrane protein